MGEPGWGSVFQDSRDRSADGALGAAPSTAAGAGNYTFLCSEFSAFAIFRTVSLQRKIPLYIQLFFITKEVSTFSKRL